MADSFRRPVARFALMACLLWMGLPLATGHRGFDDDTACNPAAVGAPRADRFRSVGTPLVPQHCALCHLQRASGGVRPAPPLKVAEIARWALTSRPDVTQGLASTTLDRQPARAPPTFLLS